MTNFPSATDLDVQGLLEQMRRMRQSFERASVRIGIVGESGTGKSSLINALFGAYVAEVGAVETTHEPQAFERDGLTFVDLPGCGTAKWPASTYVSALRLVEDYDAFIVVTRGRVMQNDIDLYRRLRAARKPTFVARNQFDSALAGELARPVDVRRNEVALRELITSDLRQQLGDSSARVYLTACLGPATFDLERLGMDLQGALSEIKQVRFLHSAGVLGREMLEAKCGAASNIVAWYAAAAAANAINPIPGFDVAVDLGILVTMNSHVLSCFGLRSEQLDYQRAKSQRIMDLVARFGAPLYRYITTEGVLALLRNVAGREAVKMVSKYIPVIGSLVAAVLGYGICVSVGSAVIEDCRGTAEAILRAAAKG